MFTGIIQKLGRVQRRTARQLFIEASFKNIRRGESLAVNGVCLTVVRRCGKILIFDLSPETLQTTNLGLLNSEERVNLEKSLRVGDPLGGHWVTGHVEAVSRILLKEPLSDGCQLLRCELPESLRPRVVLKGSIAADGVSLTVQSPPRHFFETILIPHTLRHTVLGRKKEGERVNLETDILAKYAQNEEVLAARQREGAQSPRPLRRAF
ncbi:MAG: riboflavin synthase [Elusimicrobia bacterium]|nr:riboflavin synthase [Elusimicrobiota bacterium]